MRWEDRIKLTQSWRLSLSSSPIFLIQVFCGVVGWVGPCNHHIQHTTTIIPLAPVSTTTLVQIQDSLTGRKVANSKWKPTDRQVINVLLHLLLLLLLLQFLLPANCDHFKLVAIIKWASSKNLKVTNLSRKCANWWPPLDNWRYFSLLQRWPFQVGQHQMSFLEAFGDDQLII